MENVLKHNESVTISIATIKEREESLKDTVESLIGQVDKMNIFLHGYFEVPKFLTNDKITYSVDADPESDNGDLGKLAFDVTEGYHLTCDDDLIYPSDYVEKMIEAIDEYGKEAVVSFCGSIPHKPPIGSYYLDRMAVSLFQDFEEDKSIKIPGTGVMGYHTDLVKKWDIEGKAPNMADVHVGIQLDKADIMIICRKHTKDWIKHTDKIDMDKTIFRQHYGKDVEQTDLINEHFTVPTELNMEIPNVSVVIVNTRQTTHPLYVSQCLKTLRDQVYENIEIIVVKNYNKLITIGKAWHDAIKVAKGDWILFLGDDDYISPDYITSLMSCTVDLPEETVQITSHLSMFRTNKDGKIESEAKRLIPTGMWRREYLLKEPPVEHMVKFVDVEMIDKIKKEKGKQFIMSWHYGYYYRSHAGQTSGMKLMETMKNEYNNKRTGQDVKS